MVQGRGGEGGDGGREGGKTRKGSDGRDTAASVHETSCFILCEECEMKTLLLFPFVCLFSAVSETIDFPG